MLNLKKTLSVSAIVVASLLASGCTRIETGEVGVRLNASKQIEGNELMPGSWNQTIVGSVLEFPVKDIAVNLENKTPMTKDNSALADFDITVVYGINPSSVAELYSTKSKSFHTVDEDKNVLLMHKYMQTLVNNSAYKSVRMYNALEVADNRAKLEQEIQNYVSEQLKEEKLDTSISLTVVQITNVKPNAEILKSATDYVRSQNELKIKENEVLIAKKESERMAALAANSTQSIAYMQAQAALNISEGIKQGKVNTIVVPSNITMLGSVGK